MGSLPLPCPRRSLPPSTRLRRELPRRSQRRWDVSTSLVVVLTPADARPPPQWPWYPHLPPLSCCKAPQARRSSSLRPPRSARRVLPSRQRRVPPHGQVERVPRLSHRRNEGSYSREPVHGVHDGRKTRGEIGDFQQEVSSDVSPICSIASPPLTHHGAIDAAGLSSVRMQKSQPSHTAAGSPEYAHLSLSPRRPR
jgi:hypothetical protein